MQVYGYPLKPRMSVAVLVLSLNSSIWRWLLWCRLAGKGIHWDVLQAAYASLADWCIHTKSCVQKCQSMKQVSSGGKSIWVYMRLHLAHSDYCSGNGWSRPSSRSWDRLCMSRYRVPEPSSGGPWAKIYQPRWLLSLRREIKWREHCGSELALHLTSQNLQHDLL